MVKKIVLWLLVIAVMTAIFCFSNQPSSESQELSDSLLERILSFFKIEVKNSTIEFFNVAIRKAAHFSIYALLGFVLYLLICVGYEKKEAFGVLLSPFVSLLYAITDEVHQIFIPGRSGMIKDVFIDFSGSIAGMLVAWCIVRIIFWRKRNG